METAEILCAVRFWRVAYHGDCSYALPLGGLVTVAQVATVGKVKTHEPVVRPHDGLVDLQVGGGAAQALDVNAPLLSIETEGLEGTLLAEQLDGVDVLVATVVTRARVALGVLVGHGRAQSIEDSAGSDILRGDQKDGLALALDFPLLLPISIPNNSKREPEHTII